MRIPGMLELCFAIMVMAAISSFTSSAQSVDLEDDSSFYSSGSCPLNMSETADYATDETVNVGVQKWLGSAVKDDESHILRLNLERIRSIDPSQARDLLASNTSLEEIKSKMRAEERFVITRGSIRLDDDIFKLTNITTTSSGNSSVLDANVVGPVAGPRFRSRSSNSANLAGNLSATISIVDQIGVGAGTLTMNGPDYSGTYELSLSYPSADQCARAGMAGASQGR
jgi:hypothetical protein